MTNIGRLAQAPDDKPDQIQRISAPRDVPERATNVREDINRLPPGGTSNRMTIANPASRYKPKA